MTVGGVDVGGGVLVGGNAVSEADGTGEIVAVRVGRGVQVG